MEFVSESVLKSTHAAQVFRLLRCFGHSIVWTHCHWSLGKVVVPYAEFQLCGFLNGLLFVKHEVNYSTVYLSKSDNELPLWHISSF